jgi:hypothetical protein
MNKPVKKGLNPRFGFEVKDKSKISRLKLLRKMIKSRLLEKK